MTMRSQPRLFFILLCALLLPRCSEHASPTDEQSQASPSDEQPKPCAAARIRSHYSAYYTFRDLHFEIAMEALDGAGAVIPNAEITYSTPTPQLIEIRPGVGGTIHVYSIGLGKGIVTATCGKATVDMPVLSELNTIHVMLSRFVRIYALNGTRQLNVLDMQNEAPPVPSTGPVKWTSTDPSVATVSATGVVTAVANGQTQIDARGTGWWTGTIISVDVADSTPAFSINTPTDEIFHGWSQQLETVLRGPDRLARAHGPVTWTSSRPDIVSVSPSGVVTGIGAGTSIITAISDTLRATATITAIGPPARTHFRALFPDGFYYPVFEHTMKAKTNFDSHHQVFDANGTTLPSVSAKITSSDTSIAVVYGGNIYGKKPGAVDLTLSLGSARGSMRLTVEK